MCVCVCVCVCVRVCVCVCECVCVVHLCVLGWLYFERIEYNIMLINERRSGLNLMISPSKTPFKLLQSILQYVRMYVTRRDFMRQDTYQVS